MKILFLSTWFPFAPNNGSKIRAYNLVNALHKQHDVTVVTFDPDNEWPKVKDSLEWDSNNELAVMPVPLDPFRHVEKPQIIKYVSPISLACWPSKEMGSIVEQVKKSNKFDAIVAFQEPVASYALKFDNVPRVLDVDTSFGYKQFLRSQDAKRDAQGIIRKLSWQKIRRYEYKLFGDFNKCTMVLEDEVAFFRDEFDLDETQFCLNENGIDVVHNQPGMVKKEPAALIYNGALTYSANYDAMDYFLQEIYPLIREESADVSLTITGSTKGVDLKSLALDDSVRLTGFVQDIRPYVAKSAVCVVPIRYGGGTRIKILEAMALGTPVVSTTKGAEGLAVKAGEHLIVADEPRKFSDATLELLSDPDRGRRLANSARDLVVDHYDWRKIAMGFTSLVNSVSKTAVRDI